MKIIEFHRLMYYKKIYNYIYIYINLNNFKFNLNFFIQNYYFFQKKNPIRINLLQIYKQKFIKLIMKKIILAF